MKTWSEPPKRAAVEDEIRLFFDTLARGDLLGAKTQVGHAHNDWESQIWSLWQDTWLVLLEEKDQEVADDSLEGELWKRDTDWMSRLAIEDVFHWDNEGDAVGPGAGVFVNVVYDGEVTDVSAEFAIAGGPGGLHIERRIIHVA